MGAAGRWGRAVSVCLSAPSAPAQEVFLEVLLLLEAACASHPAAQPSLAPAAPCYFHPALIGGDR